MEDFSLSSFLEGVQATHGKDTTVRQRVVGKLGEKMKNVAISTCGLEDSRSEISQWMLNNENSATQYRVQFDNLAKLKNQ